MLWVDPQASTEASAWGNQYHIVQKGYLTWTRASPRVAEGPRGADLSKCLWQWLLPGLPGRDLPDRGASRYIDFCVQSTELLF